METPRTPLLDSQPCPIEAEQQKPQSVIDQHALDARDHLQLAHHEESTALTADREPDHTLVAESRERARKAFNYIVKLTYNDTVDLVRSKIGNHEDALDIAQETYIRAFKALRRFKGEAQFTTWLYRITVNTAATYSKSRQRQQAHTVSLEIITDEDIPEDTQATHTTPPAIRHEQNVTQELLATLIKQIPNDGYRKVLVLRDVYDMKQSDIAEHMGISENAVKIRLHRARKQLKDLVEKHDSGFLNEEAA